MNISKLLSLKGKNKEWKYAMVKYALYQLASTHVNQSISKEVSESMINHYTNDYDKYSSIFMNDAKYRRGLRQ